MRYGGLFLFGALLVAVLCSASLSLFKDYLPTVREGGEAFILRPLAGEEVSNPLWVAGSARHPDREVRVRLVTGEGKVLAERVLRVGGTVLTEFETCLEYGLWAEPVAARLEVVAVRESGYEVLASVPVVLR